MDVRAAGGVRRAIRRRVIHEARATRWIHALPAESIECFVDRRRSYRVRQRSSTSTAERARDTQQQITVLLARSALLRQWSR